MAKKTIHNNSEIFQFLIKNSFDIITLLDGNGIILYESNATERILGYKSGERNQHAALDFVHPDDQQIVAEKLQKVASEPEGIESVQFRYLHAEGHWVWLEANGQNFINHPEINGIIVNSRDITKQKEREHQLQERVKELNCLQQLSQLIETQNTTEKILAEMPTLLKASWQYPEITEVKITFQNRTYQTKNFKESKWQQKTDIVVNSSARGQIQIVYLENPTTYKNPFLEEEYTLLRIVGERLGHFIEQKEKEKNYKELFESVYEGILKSDYNGIIIEANRAAAEICGYQYPDELIGKPMTSLYQYPGARKDLIREIEKKGDKVQNYEFLVKRKDGTAIWTLSNIQIIRNEKGEYAGSLGAFRDVSDYKETQKALKNRNNEIVKLLRGTRIVLESKDFLTTAQKVFNYCRELTGAQSGYVALLNENGEENDVVYLEPGGVPCNVDTSLPMPIRGLRKVVYITGETTYDNQYDKSPHTKYMPKGHVPLHNVMFAPLKKDRKVIGLLGLGNKETDFTEYDKRIAGSFAELISIALANARNLEQIKENEARYRELNATKDKFFSIISHDLKNPFSALLGFSQLALKRINKDDPKKAEKYIRLIYETTQHSVNLLDNLLQWSRLQKGKLKLKPQKVCLADTTNNVLSILHANIQEKHIRTTIDVAEDIEIEADPVIIQTTLRNLVSNAIKYSSEQGEIKITAKKHKKEVEVIVEDNGIGIKPQNRNNLFKIESGHSTLGTNQEKGTGLGLILCKEFVELHGGKIGFESEPQKGSKFHFTLPLL